MFLDDVEATKSQSAWGESIDAMKRAGVAIPQIMHLFNYKPEATMHLAAFSQAVLRGPSALSPGEREMIAALTSRVNDCDF